MHSSEKKHSILNGLEYILLLLLILAAWTIMEKRGALNTIIMPAPSKILSTFLNLVKSGMLWTNLQTGICWCALQGTVLILWNSASRCRMI